MQKANVFSKDVEKLLEANDCRIRVEKKDSATFTVDFAGKQLLEYKYNYKEKNLQIDDVVWPMPYYALGPYLELDVKRRSRKFAKLAQFIQYVDDDGEVYDNIASIVKEPMDPEEGKREKYLVKLIGAGMESGFNDFESAELLGVLTGYQLVRSVIV